MTYSITMQSPSVNCLIKNGQQVGIIINSSKGWQAYRVEPTEQVSALGPIFAPVGEPVQVSRYINQHDGGELVASALGL